MVITHKGRARQVCQKHVNTLDNRSVYKVTLYNTIPFEVTGNHRVWNYNSDTKHVSWKYVDELTNNDFIAVPKFEFTETFISFKDIIDNYIFKDKRIMGYESWKIYENLPKDCFAYAPEFTMTEDLMWLMGVLMASAHPVYNYTNTAGEYDNIQHITGIKIDIVDDSALRERIVDLLEKYFHVDSKSIRTEQSIIHVLNLFVGIILESVLVTIPFTRLCKSLVQHWLQGYASASPRISSDLYTITVNVDKHTLFFLNQMYEWLKFNQFDVSNVRTMFYTNVTLNVMQIGVLYNKLHLPGTWSLSNQIRVATPVGGEPQLFVRVHHLSVVANPPNQVYTLGIEDDHSYSICGIIAENCFLTTVDDSVEGIFKTLSDCAQISKWAGGIGINISDIRGTNSVIRGTNGHTNGIMPLLKTYNATGRYINQCFVGSTIIYTKNGPKTIKTVQPGDSVLTIDGSYKLVEKVFSNTIEKNILKIRNSYTFESIKCTDEHQLYVSKDDGITFEYRPASELCVNDVLAFPIPKETYDNEVITLNMCRLYGIVLTSGYIVKNDICMTISKKYMDTIAFIRENITRLVEEDVPRTNSIVFKFNIDISKLKHVWVYPYEKTKAIHSIFLNLPLIKLQQVLYGIFETKINIHSKSSNIYFVSSNRMFIESIRFACLRFKTLTFGNKLYTCKAYCIKIPLNENIADLCKLLGLTTPNFTVDWQIKDNHMLTKVKYIHTISYKGLVYDLQIQDNHNYTTHMGLVHNSGKRLGSFAIYLEPWHTDVFDFLNAKKSSGAEEERARDLFYGLWIPDLFMKRVESNSVWSLMCPDTCKGLTSCYGDEFERLYTKYESEGKYTRQIKARQVWDAIIESQIESGTPYMLYKDHVNKKNPQENIGVIKQSNLCTEIVLYTDNDHVSVCNLASIALPSFINNGKFEFDTLEHVTRIITRNLNKVIDYNFYPIPEAESTNKKHRPIGIGVQGMADAFAILKYPFDSHEARELNKQIFECIYYASLSESCNLAKVEGPYDYFEGSPMSKGILQFDMWNIVPSNKHDWTGLKRDIKQYGLRNSTLLAPMPTASTSQILGYNECLTGDTMVTDLQGIARPLINIEQGTNILSYSDSFNNLVFSNVVEFMDKGKQDVLTITLASGQFVECTPNHKFRVIHNKTQQYEWMEANTITRDYSMVMGIQGIDGTVYEDSPFNLDLFKNWLNNDTLTVEQCFAISRLAGFIQGDGNIITPEQIHLNVDTLYDSNLLLADLEVLDPGKSFSITDNDLSFSITIGKTITECLCTLFGDCENIPTNSTNVVIPEIFMDTDCSLSAIREFIAGYCGADGIAPYLSWIENKPVLSGCSILRAVNSNTQQMSTAIRTFMNNIMQLFNRLNVSVTLEQREYAHNDSFVNIFHVNTNEIAKFCNQIGYRYNIHKILRNNSLQLYLKYKQVIHDQWKTIISRAIGLYYSTENPIDVDILKNTIDSFESVYIHEYSIPTLTHFRECVKNRCMIDMDININPEELFKQFGILDLFASNANVVNKVKLCVPVYYIPIIDIKMGGKKRVYDINVADTHSFIANGMVSHNCIEPFTSNLYARRTLAGEFVCINKYLIKDLIHEKLWTKDIMEKLLYYKGSVQYIKEIPRWIKDVYRTVWEIKQRSLIEMAADRGAFICQSQSLNLFFENPNYNKITSAHFLSWKLGLKTGSYYIRTQSAIDAQNFTIDPTKERQYELEKQDATTVGVAAAAVVVCPMRKKGASQYDPCEACSG
jgi:ribonucleotide reductase alpha subunit/intein/homing endonuclease